MQLLHHQAVVLRSQQNEMLLATHCILPERCLSAFLQRSGKQPVGTVSALVRSEIVAL